MGYKRYQEELWKATGYNNILYPGGYRPLDGLVCVFPVFALVPGLGVDIAPGPMYPTVAVGDLLAGPPGAVVYWRFEALDGGGATLMSDEGANPNLVALTFDCDYVGANSVRVTGWTQDITLVPEWEVCGTIELSTVTIGDPFGVCEPF